MGYPPWFAKNEKKLRSSSSLTKRSFTPQPGSPEGAAGKINFIDRQQNQHKKKNDDNFSSFDTKSRKIHRSKGSTHKKKKIAESSTKSTKNRSNHSKTSKSGLFDESVIKSRNFKVWKKREKAGIPLKEFPAFSRKSRRRSRPLFLRLGGVDRRKSYFARGRRTIRKKEGEHTKLSAAKLGSAA